MLDFEQATQLVKENAPRKCYNCGKIVENRFIRMIPVVESPKDAEVPPRAPFCMQCAMALMEDDHDYDVDMEEITEDNEMYL